MWHSFFTGLATIVPTCPVARSSSWSSTSLIDHWRVLSLSFMPEVYSAMGVHFWSLEIFRFCCISSNLTCNTPDLLILAYTFISICRLLRSAAFSGFWFGSPGSMYFSLIWTVFSCCYRFSSFVSLFRSLLLCSSSGTRLSFTT